MVMAAGSRLPEDDLIKPGESRKALSWIWTNMDTSNDSGAMQEALRIEWAKSWARKRRWEEELALVEEEMRWVVVTLRYEAQVWRLQGQLDHEETMHLAVVKGMDVTNCPTVPLVSLVPRLFPLTSL
ncbi:hypothetical protein PQX77_013242 [Marasmius sp. AFHP31]|nr:hypothetical protein PQX77_013242 [Marasmius sp. AFHP31]